MRFALPEPEREDATRRRLLLKGVRADLKRLAETGSRASARRLRELVGVLFDLHRSSDRAAVEAWSAEAALRRLVSEMEAASERDRKRRENYLRQN